MRIAPMRVAAGRLGLPAGRGYSGPRDHHTNPRVRARRLNSVAIRRTLRPGPRITCDWTLDVLTDLSGSMIGGNDAAGLRHEALLVAAEHLAAGRRASPNATWHLRLHSFDDGGTCLDIDRTQLDRRHLRHLAVALLGETYGGSSDLGPSLSSSIAESSTWPGGLVRLVLSDMELTDRDVDAVLDRLVRAPADLNVVIVFRSSIPTALEGTAVRVHQVDPDTDAPETVARLITDAVADAVGTARNTASTRGSR